MVTQKIEWPRAMLKVYSTEKHLSKLFMCYAPNFEYVYLHLPLGNNVYTYMYVH